MHQTTFLRATLILSGTVVLLVGLGIQFNPADFYAAYQVDMSFNTNWLNELRAGSSYLIFSGLLIVAGVFIKRLLTASIIVSLMLYGSFVLGRLLSLAVDGVPGSALITALVIELAVGVLVLAAVAYSRNDQWGRSH